MAVDRSPSFGERLRRLREAAGLTQEQLAERAGLTAKRIGALERGERRRPYPHTVRALANALGLSDEARNSLRTGVSRPAERASSAPPRTAALPTPLGLPVSCSGARRTWPGSVVCCGREPGCSP